MESLMTNWVAESSRAIFEKQSFHRRNDGEVIDRTELSESKERRKEYRRSFTSALLARAFDVQPPQHFINLRFSIGIPGELPFVFCFQAIIAASYWERPADYSFICATRKKQPKREIQADWWESDKET